MANTERLKVIQVIREARNAVDAARFNAAAPAKTLLEQAFGELDRIEGDLILAELDSHLAQLKTDSQKLEKLAARMKKSVEGLKKVAALIEKAAKAIKILVDIASKAAGL